MTIIAETNRDIVFDNPFEFTRNRTLGFRAELYETVHIKRFLEYLTGEQRIDFFNQLSNIVVPDGMVYATVPYYSHPQGFADWRIQWPPLSEHSFLFLSADWRREHPYTAHHGYTSDLTLISYEYDVADDWLSRHDKARSEAIRHYWGVVTTLYVTLQKVTKSDA